MRTVHSWRSAAIAGLSGRTLPVLVELDFGEGRTGCVETEDAVALAQHIIPHSSLKFSGIQATTPTASRWLAAPGLWYDRLRAD